MAVIGAMGFSRQLGGYICGCGAKQASGFCATSITMPFGILLHTQLSFVLRVQRACRKFSHRKFSPLIHEVRLKAHYAQFCNAEERRGKWRAFWAVQDSVLVEKFGKSRTTLMRKEKI